MADFILKQLPYDLSNQAGLALIGQSTELKPHTADSSPKCNAG